MLQDIFLAYANYSLKDYPENLKKIFDEFISIEDIDMLTFKVSISRTIYYFSTLVRCENLEAGKELRKKTPFYHEWQKEFEIAFQGIYGYIDGYCKKCLVRNEREGMLGKNRFLGPKRLRCYECDRLSFRSVLDGIVKGQKYNDIGFGFCSLETLMANAYNSLEKGVIISSQGQSGKEELREAYFFNPRGYDERPYKGSFGYIFLDVFAAFSLTEFLLHNDRKKLKKCRKCNDFFVAKKIDERIKYCAKCSYLSPKSKEHRNQLMRAWRKRKKEEKETQKRELRIEHFMRQLGCTREEAMAIIVADSEL